MFTIYPAASRFSFDKGWLRGSHSFSFAEYQDENNTAFGPMRVCNDDVIAPGRGFGAHPHSDMEIVSIVLYGELRHEDNHGHVAVTRFGGIQRMSAGHGIIHTEHNASQTEDVSLLQLWFSPHTRGLKPSYEATAFNPERLHGQLLPVVAGKRVPGTEGEIAAINQDLTIYLSKLQPGEQVEFTQAEGRRVFLFIIEGSLRVNGEHILQGRDSARIEQEPKLSLKAEDSVFYMLIDLP
ncbi:pirin family protein [Paenibacillus sp. SEL1]|uniref:pirin family protein n=1 Tax=Paenibacillus polymyxa TaxID=1406 RepID=UPI000FAE3F64|nr:pirin family protein [Paenibacillus polymyxa]MDY8044870.1 pirin family protein [Paenibacillus polymyxa]